MDALARLGRRNALEAMAANFILERREVGAFERQLEKAMTGARVRLGNRANCSTQVSGELDVGKSEFGDEKPGVLPAFAGANFKRLFHDSLHMRAARIAGTMRARRVRATSGLLRLSFRRNGHRMTGPQHPPARIGCAGRTRTGDLLGMNQAG